MQLKLSERATLWARARALTLSFGPILLHSSGCKTRLKCAHAFARPEAQLELERRPSTDICRRVGPRACPTACAAPQRHTSAADCGSARMHFAPPFCPNWARKTHKIGARVRPRNATNSANLPFTPFRYLSISCVLAQPNQYWPILQQFCPLLIPIPTSEYSQTHATAPKRRS